MKNVDRFPKLCRIHCAIRPARMVCAHLPNGFRKTVQHHRALMPLADLRLVQRETELLTNHRRKAHQPNERVDKPNQLARLFRHYGHNPLYATSGIKWSSKTVARTVAVQKVTSHDPRNKLKMKRDPLHRSRSLRPVTSEVAGSTPSSPPFISKNYRRADRGSARRSTVQRVHSTPSSTGRTVEGTQRSPPAGAVSPKTAPDSGSRAPSRWNGRRSV